MRPNTDEPVLLDAEAAILRATAAGRELCEPSAHPIESIRCLMTDSTVDRGIELKLRLTAYVASCFVVLSNSGFFIVYVSDIWLNY
jgi:hypothetical protein